MKTVYVLMYQNTKFNRTEPYAVFEDKFTAEKMKREGDEIWCVPFFIMDQLVITDKALEGVDLEKLSPGDTPLKLTYKSIPCKDSTMAPPYNTYPRVTCQETVDEHRWTDRVD